MSCPKFQSQTPRIYFTVSQTAFQYDVFLSAVLQPCQWEQNRLGKARNPVRRSNAWRAGRPNKGISLDSKHHSLLLCVKALQQTRGRIFNIDPQYLVQTFALLCGLGNNSFRVQEGGFQGSIYIKTNIKQDVLKNTRYKPGTNQ